MKGFSLVILSFLVLLAVFSLGAEVGALITSNVIQSFDFSQDDTSLSSGLTNQGNEITHLSLNKTG